MVHRTWLFGTVQFKRVGEISMLTVFGVALYRRAGNMRAIGKFVWG